MLIWIRNLFDPGSGMEKSGSGINIPDPKHKYLVCLTSGVSNAFLTMVRGGERALKLPMGSLGQPVTN